MFRGSRTGDLGEKTGDVYLFRGSGTGKLWDVAPLFTYRELGVRHGSGTPK